MKVCLFRIFSSLEGVSLFFSRLQQIFSLDRCSFSETILFFSTARTFMDQEEEDEWLIYKVTTNTGMSSSISSYAPSNGDSTNVPPSAPNQPLVVQVYSRRDKTSDICPTPVFFAIEFTIE